MSKVILDTSAYSAFMHGHKAIKQRLQETEEIYLNPIILGELYTGFIKGKRLEKNKAELALFMNSPRVAFLNIDADTSERYAVILDSMVKYGIPIPTNDLWIAASAMQYGLRLVTTDKHFEKIPQILTERFDIQ